MLRATVRREKKQSIEILCIFSNYFIKKNLFSSFFFIRVSFTQPDEWKYCVKNQRMKRPRTMKVNQNSLSTWALRKISDHASPSKSHRVQWTAEMRQLRAMNLTDRSRRWSCRRAIWRRAIAACRDRTRAIRQVRHHLFHLALLLHQHQHPHALPDHSHTRWHIQGPFIPFSWTLCIDQQLWTHFNGILFHF